MKTRNLVCEGKDRKTGSVLVLFENRAARERAVSFCEELIAESGSGMELSKHWSSFDSLNASEKFDKALAQGGEAGIIVFAVTPDGDLPEVVKRWTERWLAKRGEREGSLVGLVLNEQAGPCEVACLKEIYLRHLAHRAGMDYLSRLPNVQSDSETQLDSLSQRAGRVTSVLDEILRTQFVPPNIPLG